MKTRKRLRSGKPPARAGRTSKSQAMVAPDYLCAAPIWIVAALLLATGLALAVIVAREFGRSFSVAEAAGNAAEQIRAPEPERSRPDW